MNVAWRVEKTDDTLQAMKRKTFATFIRNNLRNTMTLYHDRIKTENTSTEEK